MSKKSPNWSRSLGLAALLVVLSSAVYWLEFSKKPATEKAKEQEKKVFHLTEDPATEVTLVQGASVTTLGCLESDPASCRPGQSSKWELRAPVRLKADDSTVQSLLSSLNNLLPTDSIDLSADSSEKRKSLLQQYGLSDEQRRSAQRVTLQLKSGEVVALVLGDSHPMGETIFGLIEAAKTQGEPLVARDARILLLPNGFKSALSHPLTHWRDKKMVTLASSDMSEIEIESIKGRTRAIKKDAQWSLDGRDSRGNFQGISGDIENIDNWASTLAFLAAREFAAEKKDSAEARKRLSGAKAIFQIRIASTAGRKLTLAFHEKRVGKDGTELLATVSDLDPLFELDSSVRQRLEKSVADLRLARLLASMDRFNVREISFESAARGKAAVVWTQKDGKWSSPSAGTEDKISPLLEKLSGNRITSFGAVSGNPKDSLVMTLKDEKGGVLRRLQFWREGAKLLGRDLLSKRVESFELDSSLADSLPWENKPSAAPAAKP